MPASGDAPALTMRGITKTYGAVQALSNVDLTVAQASVHALVGENGSGKSTLMKILAAAIPMDAGSITVNGAPVSFTAPADAIRAGVAVIYQELSLAPHLTAAENIFLGMEPSRIIGIIDRKQMRSDARALAARYGFTIDADKHAGALSAGEAQIVEILKALARNARIIAMDEPTSSLSETEAEALMRTVRSLTANGVAVIYISHRLNEIMAIADAVTVLRDGIVAETRPRKDITPASLIRAMVGRDIADIYPARTSTPGNTMLAVNGLATENGLRDISFTVRRGEILGIAGLAGAGRTRLARTIFGIDRIRTGTMALDGKALSLRSPTDAIAHGIALLTEDRKRTGLCLPLSCTWNVTLAVLTLIGMRFFIRPKRETECVRTVGAQVRVKWADPSLPASSLSGGNQQKLLIARWLLADARLIIFDEPTRGIDVGAKREIYERINTLAAEGKAVIVISSELPELLGMSDRIIVMRRGNAVAELDAKTTTQEAIMHYAATEDLP